MKRAALALALLATMFLTDCAGSFAGSISRDRTVQVQTHQSIAIAPTGSVHVQNVSGTINIIGWNQPRMQLDAVTYGATKLDVDKTHIRVHQDGDMLDVKTTTTATAFSARARAAQASTTHCTCRTAPPFRLETSKAMSM
ncbi:MAG: hypothetical protein ACXVA3_15575 [Vulcanimicrobiaceae bacterium]